MDWYHLLTVAAAFTAPYLPTIGARADQWFQAWLKAKYGQTPPTETKPAPLP